MLWDLVLFFAALALAAVGAVNLGTAPIWFVLAVVCAVVGLGDAIHRRRKNGGGAPPVDLSLESSRTWVCVAPPKLRVGFAARGLRPLGSVRYADPKEPWTDVQVGPLSRTDPIRCTFVGWWKEGRPVELQVQSLLIGGLTRTVPLRFTSRHIRATDYTVRIGPDDQGPDMRDIHHLEFIPHLNPTYFGFAQMAVHLVDGRTLVSSGGAFDGGSGWQDVARGFIQFADPSHDIRRPCVVVGAGGKVAGLFMSHTGDATDLDNALRSLP